MRRVASAAFSALLALQLLGTEAPRALADSLADSGIEVVDEPATDDSSAIVVQEEPSTSFEGRADEAIQVIEEQGTGEVQGGVLRAQGDEDDTLTYRDADGNEVSTTAYTRLQGSFGFDSLEPGVYYIASTVTFTERVRSTGDLTIVFAPEAKLICYKGIDVASGASLLATGTLGSNDRTTSQLVCKGPGDGSAAIGGEAGALEFYGVYVEAKNEEGGYGVRAGSVRLAGNAELLSTGTTLAVSVDDDNLTLYDNAYVLYGTSYSTSPGEDRVANCLATTYTRVYPCDHAVVGTGYEYQDETYHRFNCPECGLRTLKPHTFGEDGYCTEQVCGAMDVTVRYYQNFEGGAEDAYATGHKVMHRTKNAYLPIGGVQQAGPRACFELKEWNIEPDGKGYRVLPNTRLNVSSEVDGNGITLNGLKNLGYVTCADGTQSFKLYAQWTRVAHKVTYVTNGAAAMEDQIVPLGELTIEPEPPVWDDLTFGGWYADEDLTTPFMFGTTLDSDVTAYAKWDIPRTIQFSSDFGEGTMEPIVVDNGASVTLPPCAYTRQGKCFYGWNPEGSDLILKAGETYRPTDNVTLYAQWEDPVPYATAEGGSEVCEDFVKLSDLDEADPMRAGRWYVAEESETRVRRLEVAGDVNLILCDGVTLTATEGIHVPQGASLTIWAQQGGSGTLVASTTHVRAAAIGGDRSSPSGAVTIEGGVVEASGPSTGRAIGGGQDVFGSLEEGPLATLGVYATAKVNAGASASAATLADASERSQALRQNVYARVEPCDHPGGFGPVYRDHDYHVIACAACGTAQGEPVAHSYGEDGTCVCGAHEGSWSLEEVKDEGAEYGSSVRAVFTPDGGEPEQRRPQATLVIQDKEYDGQEAFASVEADDDFPAPPVIVVSNVWYVDSRGVALDGAPTDAGSYQACVLVEVMRGGTGPVQLRTPFTISMVRPDVDVKARELSYTANPQDLVTVTGDLKDGALFFSLDGRSWSQELPQATNAGSYEVRWYYLPSNGNYQAIGNAGEPQTLSVTIGEANHLHGGMPFGIAWNALDTLPTEAGNYYLTNDVLLSEDWRLERGDQEGTLAINLCLNGHELNGGAHSLVANGAVRLGIWGHDGVLKNLTGDHGGLLTTEGADVGLHDITVTDCAAGYATGALTANNGGSLTLEDAEVKNCTGSQGAVCAGSGYHRTALGQYVYTKVRLEGAPLIAENAGLNLTVTSENSIHVGTLREGARVGISLGARETGKLTTGWSENNAGVDPADVFFCDAKPQLTGDNLYIGLDGGEAAILTHYHSWSFELSEDESTAYVSCVAPGCAAFETNHTYTVSIAPDVESIVEDGGSYGAEVTRDVDVLPGDPSIVGVIPLSFSVSDVEYWRDGSRVEGTDELDYLTGKPYKPGVYEARLMLQLGKVTKTIKCGFEILKKEVEIPEASVVATARQGLTYDGGRQIELCDFGEWVNATSVQFRVDDSSWRTYNKMSAQEAGIPAQYQAEYNANMHQLPKASEIGTHLVEYYIPDSTMDDEITCYGYGSEEEPKRLEVTIAPSVLPTFEKQQLVLTGELAFVAYLSLPEDEGITYDDSYVTFEIGGRRGRTVRVDYADAKPNSDRTLQGFRFELASVEMAEPVKVTLHYTWGGEERTVVKENASVAAYIEGFVVREADFGPYTRGLVHAIADYGHWVQPFLADSNKWVIGTDYQEMTRHYIDSHEVGAYKAKVNGYGMSKDLGTSAVKNTSARMTLDSQTMVEFYLTTEGGVRPDITSVKMGDVDHGFELAQTSDGRWCVRTEGLRANQLGNTITVVGQAGAGEFQVSMSPLAYVKAVLSSEEYATYGHDAMCALYDYYKATYDFMSSYESVQWN